MLRHLALALLLFATATSAAAAEPTPLADADLSLDDLNTDERTFYLRAYMSMSTGKGEHERVTVRPKDAGTFTLGAKKTDDAIVFHSTMKLTIMGEMTIDQTTTCVPSILMPPTAIDMKMQRGNRTQEAKLTIKDGVATATAPNGETQSREGFPPENAVTFPGLISLLELLPRDADQAWTVSAVGEMIEMGYFHPAEEQEHILIQCIGKEDIQLADKKLTCTRFDIKTGNKRNDVTAWVNDDGLQQMLLGTDMRMSRHPMKPIDDENKDPFLDAILKAVEEDAKEDE